MAQIVPDEFLTSSVPCATAQRIDFSKTKLECYAKCYATVLSNILSPEECSLLIKYAETAVSEGWQRAMINVGGGKQRLVEDERKCARMIWNQQSIVDRIWARCQPLVPELQKLDSEHWPRLVNKKAQQAGGYKLTRVNERMRLLKYNSGDYFKHHCDAASITSEGEKSFFTIHVYLNDADHQDSGQELIGGATCFWDYSLKDERRVDVRPTLGSVLIFQHADLLHSGEDILSGTKYTMRSDILYKLVG